MSIDLEAIKARLAQATPGPWSDFCESGDWWLEQVTEEGQGTGSMICKADDLSYGDQELIAHAPQDIAALIAEVERLQGIVTHLVTTAD